MKAHFYLQGNPGEEKVFLAKVNNLEVCPRGIYVIDGKEYELNGEPTFYIDKLPYLQGDGHALMSVELVVTKR